MHSNIDFYVWGNAADAAPGDITIFEMTAMARVREYLFEPPINTASTHERDATVSLAAIEAGRAVTWAGLHVGVTIVDSDRRFPVGSLDEVDPDQMADAFKRRAQQVVKEHNNVGIFAKLSVKAVEVDGSPHWCPVYKAIISCSGDFWSDTAITVIKKLDGADLTPNREMMFESFVEKVSWCHQDCVPIVGPVVEPVPRLFKPATLTPELIAERNRWLASQPIAERFFRIADGDETPFTYPALTIENERWDF